MLSNSNVSKINRQIEVELREVSSFLSSDEDKLAAIDRIAKLKALLTPQPSRADILAELAAALVEAQKNSEPTLAANLIDIVTAICNKH